MLALVCFPCGLAAFCPCCVSLFPVVLAAPSFSLYFLGLAAVGALGRASPFGFLLTFGLCVRFHLVFGSVSVRPLGGLVFSCPASRLSVAGVASGGLRPFSASIWLV